MRASRVDRNQAQLARLAEVLGGSVWPVHEIGGGGPDLAVGRIRKRTCASCGLVTKENVNLLWEIKDGELPPARRQLTGTEKLWHLGWNGQVDIIEGPTDVYKAFDLKVREL